MIGDDFVINPIVATIHEAEFAVAPDTLWPWLVQVGAGRAGWYSWDWIDNLGRKSATSILPEYQHLQVGDIVPGYPGAKSMFVVRAIHPCKYLVLGVPRASGDDLATWTLELVSKGAGCRLRAALRLGPVHLCGLRLPAWSIAWPLRLGHHIMQTKQFRELRRRCEPSAH